MTPTTSLLHLSPTDYHVIRAEDFGSAGLTARESIGPMVDLQAVGPLLTVHDSTFEPHSGIGHHPHQRMERLFYILEGAVDHDDALNSITGHMGTGDLGILTEGRRGMVHSEWNNTDGGTRCYILVYPTQPLPETAAFDAIRDAETRRAEVRPGVVTKHVVERGETRLHGDVREFGDSSVAEGAALELSLEAREAGLVFVLDGEVTVPDAAETATEQHTIVVPPAEQPRRLLFSAQCQSRLLHAVTGPGYGLRRRNG